MKMTLETSGSRLQKVCKPLGLILLLWIAYIPYVHSQELSLKHNVIYGARGTLNIGAEYAFLPKQSIALDVLYNPWVWGDNKKKKLLLFRPEYRYWLNDAFMGHFVGFELHGGMFNFSKTTPFTTIINNRYQGYAYGCGLTYGYQFLITRRWNLEASISFGYTRLDYEKFGPDKNDYSKGRGHANIWSPTHLGLTFVYFIL